MTVCDCEGNRYAVALLKAASWCLPDVPHESCLHPGSGNPWSALLGDLWCNSLPCSAQTWRNDLPWPVITFLYKDAPFKCVVSKIYDLLLGVLCQVWKFVLLLPLSFGTLWRQKQQGRNTSHALWKEFAGKSEESVSCIMQNVVTCITPSLSRSPRQCGSPFPHLLVWGEKKTTGASWKSSRGLQQGSE